MWGKNLRRKTLSVIVLIVFGLTGFGQVNPYDINKDYSFTTRVHDYDALGINPANIAAHKRNDKKISFGLIHIDGTLLSSVLKNRLFHRQTDSGEPGAGGIVNTIIDGGLWFDDILAERTAVNTDLTLLGVSFKTKKAGMFAISLKSNFYAEGELNGVFEELEYGDHSFVNVTEVVINTILDNIEKGAGQVNDLTDDSYIKANITNEINIGYSNRLINKKNFKGYGGVGIKYISGFFDVGLQFDENEIKGYYALSSLLPDNLEEHNILSETKSNKRFGNGFGSSLGFAMTIGSKTRIGVSFMDLGFIKWPSKSIFITQEDAINLATNDVQEEVSDVINSFQRKSDNLEVLPAKFILGASYNVHQYVGFYLDFVAPLNDSYKNITIPIIGTGTHLSLKGFVTLKAGVTLINKRNVTVPVYISFYGGKNKSFEFSAGTADLISFFKSNRNYMQTNLALMKFHF